MRERSVPLTPTLFCAEERELFRFLCAGDGGAGRVRAAKDVNRTFAKTSD
jgi:hypothetical protein